MYTLNSVGFEVPTAVNMKSTVTFRFQKTLLFKISQNSVLLKEAYSRAWQSRLHVQGDTTIYRRPWYQTLGVSSQGFQCVED